MIVGHIFDIMRTINEKEKVAILLVEQNAVLALELADHAYLLETGRMVISGSAKDLRNDDSVRRSYLGY
jgi:branched-chain amino acid transport system ATP-binding protein